LLVSVALQSASCLENTGLTWQQREEAACHSFLRRQAQQVVQELGPLLHAALGHAWDKPARGTGVVWDGGASAAVGAVGEPLGIWMDEEAPQAGIVMQQPRTAAPRSRRLPAPPGGGSSGPPARACGRRGWPRCVPSACAAGLGGAGGLEEVSHETAALSPLEAEVRVCRERRGGAARPSAPPDSWKTFSASSNTPCCRALMAATASGSSICGRSRLSMPAAEAGIARHTAAAASPPSSPRRWSGTAGVDCWWD
jgi:hypothetical protein